MINNHTHNINFLAFFFFVSEIIAIFAVKQWQTVLSARLLLRLLRVKQLALAIIQNVQKLAGGKNIITE